MSILLKHTNIPKYGHRIVILSDGHAYYEDFINPYIDLGEIISLPPHGELIDRDAAVQDLRMDYAYAAANIVMLQPTIIPAEEDERRLQKPKEWET